MQSLLRKWKKSCAGVTESAEVFAELNSTADQEMVAEWAESERVAMSRRVFDVKAMKIYEVQVAKGLLSSPPHHVCPDGIIM